MIARNDPPNSPEMLVLVLVLKDMVLVLERRSRDPCGQFPAGHAQWIVTVRSMRCYRYSAIVAVVYLRWFIQEGLPKELLNKRRKN